MDGCSGSPKANTPGNAWEMYKESKDVAKVGLCTIQDGDRAEDNGQQGYF